MTDINQTEWEAQKALKVAIANRQKLNKEILHHFAYGPNAAARGFPASGASLNFEGSNPQSRLGTPDIVPGAPARAKGISLAEYEDRKKGLVSTGNWRVRVEEDDCDDLPGGKGIHVYADGDWNFRTKECPTVASRLILSQGKHLYRIRLQERDGPFSLLASDGQIKIGFFDKDIENVQESWMSPGKDGKVVRPVLHPNILVLQSLMYSWLRFGQAWYYCNLGNIYNGSRAYPNANAPGFQPGDVVTAVVNINDGTASFSKKRVVKTRYSTFEETSNTVKVTGISTNGVRFGIQFSKAASSVVLLEYENLTADDASVRAIGFKGIGLMHIKKGEWAEAIDCFQKAVTHYHNAGDIAGRKESAEMFKEAKVLLEHDGCGSEFDSPFLPSMLPMSRKKT